MQKDFIRILLNRVYEPSLLFGKFSHAGLKKKSENKKLMYVHKVEILLSSD